MKTNEIEILFRQHYNQMIQLARMMLYDDEESRDVVSEVFATLVKTDIRGERGVCHAGKDGHYAEVC